jgi:hypothetical protein
MNTEKQLPQELGNDPYAMFAPDPNGDISITITAHRGGGGSFGGSGVAVFDTMSTEIKGSHRRLTEAEGSALHEAARSIARILVAVRTQASATETK